jgi:radical SAM/Cys-rich protein
MKRFEENVAECSGDALYCHDIETLQCNLGFKCNQQCAHCHVSASPTRTEIMEWHTMELVLAAARDLQPKLVDLTGGAPELNPHFKKFVEALRMAGHEVQVRTNLTALLSPGLEDTAQFLADYKVGLVASMPCYLEENVRAQRGAGAYEKSVAAMKMLNGLGYGYKPELRLDLVYNPGGAFLPPAQAALESDYRRELFSRFGLVFSNLLTITNMPLGRFWSDVKRMEKDREYLELLGDSFNPATIDGLMCRHQVSVGWDGRLYDCDFNLSLGLPVEESAPQTIGDFDAARLAKRKVVTGLHCYGCTAGCGSSCRGALV